MQQPVAVVTGGTGALGRALVPLLLRRKYSLAITYLMPEEARGFEDQFDLDESMLLLRRVDATDAEAISSFMKQTAEHFGGFNVLCSLVGGWAGGRDVAETDDVRFNRMLDLNLRSAFNTIRAAIPHMRDAEWGRIIAVGSKAAFDAPSGQAAYNIAKAGVVALIKSVASELGDTGITANAILPTVIDTDATRAALPYADYVSWPKPAEIAVLVDFLASEGSGVINGAAIPVTGST
ncbi:MAG TPA: SDR family NAD(P)-dependent oxidoreductase [Acidimicrobiia bacterium]|jgi:NAD(P)-dependent dehydrogenase (short-subunit alcohol dehydrogenase family)